MRNASEVQSHYLAGIRNAASPTDALMARMESRNIIGTFRERCITQVTSRHHSGLAADTTYLLRPKRSEPAHRLPPRSMSRHTQRLSVSWHDAINSNIEPSSAAQHSRCHATGDRALHHGARCEHTAGNAHRLRQLGPKCVALVIQRGGSAVSRYARTTWCPPSAITGARFG